MKNNIPLLSVILPAYNVEKYIGQCLDSILAQTFVDFELIIADDGSNDKTRKIIDTYKDPRIIISHNSANLGKIKTVNSLLPAIQGKYFTVHDSDDISKPTRFEKQIKLLETSEYVMCGTSFETIDIAENYITTHIQPSDLERIKIDIMDQSQFHGPTMIVKSDILTKVGGFYRIMKYGEDIDFSMRVIEKYSATNLKEVLYSYRSNPTSITKNSKHDLLQKFIDRKLIYTLAQERCNREDGKDSLMRNDFKEIDRIKNEVEQDLNTNIVSYVDEYAAYLLHYDLHSTAFLFVLRQWLKHPKKLGILRIALFIIKSRILYT